MLNRQSKLTLAHPTAAPTATSTSRSAYFNTLFRCQVIAGEEAVVGWLEQVLQEKAQLRLELCLEQTAPARSVLLQKSRTW